MNFHGPYEQTWVNGELPYTQGKILSVDDSTDLGTMTVQASPLGKCLTSICIMRPVQHPT